MGFVLQLGSNSTDKHTREQLVKRVMPEGMVWKLLSENWIFSMEYGLVIFQGQVSWRNKAH